jgi:exodeoxyribonuclease V beta subunit
MTDIPAFQLADTALQQGVTLIEASAGTGKTYTIAGLFLRLILEEGLSVREILVVTFTEAATGELRGRIRQTLADASAAFTAGRSDVQFLQTLTSRLSSDKKEMLARLDRALCDFDEAPIYTIHGFCQRTLKDRAFESGALFDVELQKDINPLLRELADDYWRRHFYKTEPLLAAFAFKNGLAPESFVPLLESSLRHPGLTILSPAGNAPLDRLAGVLQEKFIQAQAIWRAENDTIRGCFGAGAKWARKPYNNPEAMHALFSGLEQCFGDSAPSGESIGVIACFTPMALAREASVRKGAPAPPNHRFFNSCEAICEAEQGFLAGLKLDFLRWAEAELPRRKSVLKVQSFDDLLSRLSAALIGPGGPLLAVALRQRYQAALIDEFQDTDPVQHGIFQRAFTGGGHFLFLIGDPKQAIYGFRGADIFTYLDAVRRVDRHYTLGENWRSDPALVAAVNTLFKPHPRPFVFGEICFPPVAACPRSNRPAFTMDGRIEPPLHLWFWPREGKDIPKTEAEDKLPGIVASEIARLLNGAARLGDRPLLPEDIAVLVMENQQAGKMQRALAALNIPSVLHTTASLFESAEATEIRRLLSAIAQPSSERLLKAALAMDLLGGRAEELGAFDGDAQRLENWQQRFAAYLELWQAEGFIQMFRRFLEREGVPMRLLLFPDGERRLTNVLHLGEVLHRATAERRLGPSRLVKWLGEQQEQSDLPIEEHQLRLERDDNAVKLVTIHRSKGLEYGVVFCPFLFRSAEQRRGGDEEVLFHDSTSRQLTRDLGSAEWEAHRRLAIKERLAENIRLLYVALTRARHRCCIVWGGFRGAATSAPAWLFHPIPQIEAELPIALERHFRSLHDGLLQSDLLRLAERSRQPDGNAAIAVSNLPKLEPQSYQPTRAPSVTLCNRVFSGRISRNWRVTSFSSLAAEQPEERPDHDQVDTPDRPAEAKATGIFAFPRGAKPGTCLHEILQHHNFSGRDESVIRKLVEDRLHLHGLAAADFAATIVQMLGELANVPWEGEEGRFTLAQIPLAARLSELEFCFPIHNLSVAKLHLFLQQAQLAGQSVPPEIGRTSIDSVSGFIKGFIDLIFQHEGRFYLVDWKSNWLGNCPEDYQFAALAGEMVRRQYHLQSHLYAVALHKYLACRLPGYEFQKHFGGIHYVFLRGVDRRRPELGFYRHLPKLEVLLELNAVLDGGAR